MGSLHFVAQTAFDDLLTRWRHHSCLRDQAGTSVPELSDSRHLLDQARHRMHMLRAALYPTVSEQEEIVITVLCGELDEVVHLNWTRRDHIDPRSMTCVCGERFALEDRGTDSIAEFPAAH